MEKGETSNLFNDETPETRRKVKTEIDLYFPPGYIDDDEERLKIYRRLSELETFEEIDEFEIELLDRFGQMPDQARWLLNYFKLSQLSNKLALRNCQVKHDNLILEFDAKSLPSKEQLLHFISKIDQPFRFEAGKNLKVIIDLNPDANYLQQFETALSILQKW